MSDLYDKDGRWVEERGRVKGAIRRAYRMHPHVRELLRESRVELPPKTLKDGSVGKKNQIRQRCNVCGNLFPTTQIQVDHISPVVPLDVPENSLDRREWVGMIFEGIFCEKGNLQVICSTPKRLLEKGQESCHGAKSRRENFIRGEFKKLLNGESNTVFNKFCRKEGEKIIYSYREVVEFFSKMYDDYLRHLAEEKAAKEARKKSKKSK
jgi:hypothetical protein